MELIISDLLIAVEKDTTAEYLKLASRKLKCDVANIKFTKILSKSLKMDNPEQFYYEISIVVNAPNNFDNKERFPLYSEKIKTDRKPVNAKEKPIIVGFGPAGIFAALEFLDYGVKPLIFERGKNIEDRNVDIQRFINEKELNPESNIQFGEGGAGSYSDGKLFSRIRNNSNYFDKVLNTFIKFGAAKEIGYVSKPHLGTDIISEIVRNMRKHILENGGEIHYNSKITDIIISDRKIQGVIVNGTKEYFSSNICLAIGHSARDTFEMLHNRGVALEQNPISVGLRIEHPRDIIDLMRYGFKYKDFRGMEAATYSFNHTDRKTGRGAYTFCMCPGGEVLNASSEKGLMVLNGMSYSDRSSPYSNSAITVKCHTADYKSTAPLAGIEFQRTMERKAFTSTGKTWKAPAQNLVDFLDEKTSSTLNKNSFKMGVASVSMNEILPDFICESLSLAFTKWKIDYPLFVSEHAILLGVETRTSSPVKIRRDEKYESVNIKNLYPIGEGSGYTGGITSSAVDAIKSVELQMSKLGSI